MNICFDSVAFLAAKNRGMGNYTIAQLKEILSIDKENNYFILNFLDEELDLDFLNEFKNVKVVNYSSGRPTIDRGNITVVDLANIYPDVFGDIIAKFVEEYDIDLFYVSCVFWDYIDFKKEWFGKAKVIATMYDMIPALFEKQYLPNKYLKSRYYTTLKSITKFDGFLAISHSAKSDFVKLTHFDPNKIDVIGGAPSDIFKVKEVSALDKDNLKKKFGITKDFVICTGGDDYRKNLESLITAFSKIKQEYLDTYQLVIVCKLSKERETKLKEVAKNNNIENNVVLTNFVSDEELINLLNMSSATAFPSLYEGFGLPVVESYAVNKPNLTSNNSSLGEIAKGSSILVDPTSISGIANGLNKLLDKNNWATLIKKGQEKLKTYNWKNIAKISINFFNKITKDENKKRNIKRIAIFTPLPPLKSGISDYSYALIDELAKSIDVDIYIDKGYLAKAFQKTNIHIYSYKKFKNNVKKYDEIIYEMGNSTFHTYMIPYIKKYKGIVELHDGNYFSLINYLFTNKKITKKEYKDIVSHDKENLNKQITRNYFIDNAKSIIVHNEYLKKEILKTNITKVISIPLFCKSLNIPINSSDKVFNITSAGYIHENKRSFEIVQAFKLFSDKVNNSHLYLIGEAHDKEYKNKIIKYINENNLNEKVTITGFIDDLNEFLKYMQKSTISLNLRYPFQGESSGSLSQYLSLNIPTIVNDVGSMKEFPNDVVIKIPPKEEMDNEVEVIYQTLKKFYDNQTLLLDMKINIQKYIEDNLLIDKVIDKYISYINNDRKIHLTTDIFNKIIDYEIIKKNYTKKEIDRLIKTFADILSFNN